MRTIYPLKLSSTGQEKEELLVRLVLQLVQDDDERKWVRQVCRDDHYLHREVNGQARWVAYLAIREQGVMKKGCFVVERRDKVGILVFSRMESSRCRGWYGSLADVASGWAQLSQWELITLSRCWLDPRLQRGGCWHIPKAASLLIREALKHIQVDYLLCYPPAHFNQPWRLKQVISYCQSERFICMLYWFSRFKLVRENKKGLKTFMHPLPDLTEEQERAIVQASYANKAARKKRGKALVAAITHEVLLIRRPLIHRKAKAA